MVEYNNFDYKNIEYDTIKNSKKITYINIEAGFDIETTSTYINEEKVAFMYEWTFGIKDKNFICYGRTWEQFIELCEKLQKYFDLNDERILVVYIHNFSFEFQFMCKYFKWLNVFAVDERKPIKALCEYGIEFRDSYILSGYSLEKTAENLKKHNIEKLVGNLDYNLIRTPDTILSEKELEYCEHDVLIILYYINEQIYQYGDIVKIPLTNTGRVRKFVKDNCYHSCNNHRKESKRKFWKYRDLMKELQLTDKEYKLLKRAFQGGFTHANYNYSGKLLSDVSSIDFTSSYPAVMLSERFPMSRGIEVKFTSGKDFYYYLKNYCLVFDVEFTNIKSSINYENYISESKCLKLENGIINNGRVYSADLLVTTITDVDFNIIKNCYTWDKIGVKNVIRYCRGYLPKDIILSILKLYEDKTTLKGVKEKEVEYMLSKGMLNSVYGMSVTDIVRDDITFNDEYWIKKPSNLTEQIEKYNESFNRFLSYPWGVWVTAYARRNLWLGIKNIKDDYIYSDTDSIKMVNYDKHIDFIKWYERLITGKLYDMCDHYNIDKSRLNPETINGVKKMIGVWDYEGTYTHFKTLGAKRYLVEKDDELFLTVAGLSKRNGIEYMKNSCDNDHIRVFNMFNDDLYIPANKTGKMTHTYIDDEQDFYILDYQGNESHIITKSGVHLEACDFTLSISKQYAKFLKMFMKGYIFKGVKEGVG